VNTGIMFSMESRVKVLRAIIDSYNWHQKCKRNGEEEITIYFCSLCRGTIKINSDIATEHHNKKHGTKSATYHEIKSVSNRDVDKQEEK